MDYQITFDENDIRDIKISTNGLEGDSEIIKMLCITPLIAGNLIEENYEEDEKSITVHALPEKGEDALHQMASNIYSVFKCLKDSVENNKEVMESLQGIYAYMNEVRGKTYKEIFDLLEKWE